MLAFCDNTGEFLAATLRRGNAGSNTAADTLRYRLLHVSARLSGGQRRLWLRIQRCWSWARDLAAAFARLAALPVPAG
jgi:hypothetical protein